MALTGRLGLLALLGALVTRRASERRHHARPHHAQGLAHQEGRVRPAKQADQTKVEGREDRNGAPGAGPVQHRGGDVRRTEPQHPANGSSQEAMDDPAAWGAFRRNTTPHPRHPP